MQVDGYLRDFGQADLPPCNRVGFELRKQHGLHLSKLLEAWKAKSSFLEVVPSVMQTTVSLFAKLEKGLLPTEGILSSPCEVRLAECN